MSTVTKTQKVPKLRFREFSGEWQDRDFGDLVTKITESYNSANSTESYETIELESLSQGTGKLIQTFPSLQQKSTKTKFQKGDVLYGKLRPYLRKFYHADFNGVCTSEIWVLRAKAITDDYLYHLVQSDKYNIVVDIQSGSKMPRADWKTVAKAKFSIPSKEEQKKIAGFLGVVDEKIQKLQEKKELLEKYKKGIMQKIFSQQIRFKDENGKNYPGWEEMKLGEIADINPKTQALPEKFIYIDLDSVSKGTLLRERIIDKVSAPSRAQRLLMKGDILFQTVRPYQMNNLYFDRSGSYVASTGYAQIRAKHNSKLLYQYLHLYKFVHAVLGRCTGTSYPSISPNDLVKIDCKLPSSDEEQQKIAEFLTALDDKIKLEESKLEQAEQFKKALLQQMFV